MKIKLGLNRLNTDLPAADGAQTPLQTPTPGSSGGFKLKFKASQPSTPAAVEGTEPHVEPLAPPPSKIKRAYNKKPKQEGVKRAAEADISPAAKRSATEAPSRRISFKVGGNDASADTTPTSAGPKLKLARRQSTGPKNLILTAKKKPPKRAVGVGYDSEASDAETDPAIEQQFVLRMAPGEHCDYLREAITNKTIGLRPEEGGADVSLRFVDRDLRRAVVTVKATKYAACMVDLPCIVEGMKSWDRRGWWKVADVCQMLLVLGICTSETEAKTFALPREVNRENYAYAHGLTPPMHFVRKRRFRKRVSYREIENVDEEVERLLKDDAAAEKSGGKVDYQFYDQNQLMQAQTAQQEVDDAEYEEEGDYMETTENGYGQAVQDEQEEDDEDFDATDLAAELEAGLAEDEDEGAEGGMVAADAAASLGDVLSAQTPSSATYPHDTSAADTPAGADDEPSSDEDEDDDFDSPDAIDEDALAMQQEEAQKRSEIEDLEKEVENAQRTVERTTNMLLKGRAKQQLKALEEELSMKRKAFGMELDDEA